MDCEYDLSRPRVRRGLQPGVTEVRGGGRLIAGILVAALSGCAALPDGRHDTGAVSGSAGAEETSASVGTSAAPAPSAPGSAAASSAQEPSATDQTMPGADPGPAVLWERLRGGFALEIPDNPRVEREWAWYADHPGYLDRVQDRARPYLHFILDEVEARGLPHELALLPVVESAYQPFADSPRRAAGIWQFIPSTGRHYGLKQTWWYDGRRDIAAATRAALDYLTELNGQFDGDWALTLAAYNAGGGTVRAAIRENRRRGRPTDYWALDLPGETETYVPRFMGIARLFADPAAAGLELESIPDTPYLTEVDIDSQIDLALAADLADLEMDELYQLNPGYSRWATDPDGPHRLLLPLDKAQDFRSALAELEPDERVTWQRYRIRSGDNLGAIAHRHHTTVAVLRRVNNLRSSLIRAGDHLLIPESVKDPQHYAESAEERLAGEEEASPGEHRVAYVVQPGDTLWDIARANGVGHRELAAWNDMSTRDTLRPGQELAIWTDRPAGGGNGERYRVRRGDSLYEIARRFGVSIAQLREWNAPLGRYIHPGQSLVVARVSESTEPASRGGPPDAQSSLRYDVRKGDSLYEISRRFNVTIADLRRWNDLSGKRYLQPGQRLKVYVNVAEQSAL